MLLNNVALKMVRKETRSPMVVFEHYIDLRRVRSMDLTDNAANIIWFKIYLDSDFLELKIPVR